MGGFRFIFPLFYNNTYIGSVETSVPLSNFIKYLSKEYKGNLTILYQGNALTHIRKSIFDKKFKKLLDTNFYLDNDLQNNILDKYTVKIIKENINLITYHNRPLVINFQKDKEMYSLIFYPINGIDGTNIGYILKYVYSPELKINKSNIFHQVILSLFQFTLITIFIIFIILRDKRLSNEINLRREIQNKLEDTNKMFEMVIKSSDQIVYIYDVDQNQIKRFGAINETLGYTLEEFAYGSYTNFKEYYLSS